MWYNFSMTAKRILIVDDDIDLREALESALSHAGFDTLTANDGAEGLRVALENKPDLILLDIMMPIKTGHETLNALRRDSWGKTVPVIFLTNFDDATNIAQGFKQKGDEYIIKSGTSLESIVKKVKQYLGGYHD